MFGRNHFGTGLVVLMALSVGGCASIRSVRLSDEKTPERGGMVYYLPTQQLELTMIVDDKGANLSLNASKAMADVDYKYIAQFRRNHVGTNEFEVKANADGLLSGEISGSTTGNLGDAIKALASTAGGFRALNTPDADKCKQKGTYKWVFGLTSDTMPTAALRDCKLAIVVSGLDGKVYSNDQNKREWSGTDGGKAGTGFFYRQRLPVVVTVKYTPTGGAQQDFVFYESIVGKHSPTEYLPVPRTLFATSHWKLTFDNGVPTVYDIDAGGDLIGVFKLPAEVLVAYSDAVAAGFTKKKTSLANEIAYLEELNKLALQQSKNEACRVALQTRDDDKIKAACN